ncbi:MAG TPA: HD domain-containing phosphohydrolase [Dehalococcoidia bacterium]|nr:HD domain-containing phosphohydrolase [Dehalococcoidia bacterium]
MNPDSPASGSAESTEKTRGGTSLWIARSIWLVAIASTIAALVLHRTSGSQIDLLLGAQVPAILLAGLCVDLLLRRAQRRLHTERGLALQARHDDLEEAANRDDLTQLQNRRFFYHRLEQELKAAARTRRPLSVVMIDVDDLKLLNDEFGHQVGDIVLRNFARILNRHAGPNYVTARLGGDEFAVILPETDRRNAEQFGWRLWDELGAGPIHESENASIYLGVSLGVGGYPWGGTDLEEVIHWADTKLYANKLERKGFKKAADLKADNRLASAVVEVLSSALDVRDRMTHRHAQRVAHMTVNVARELGLTDEESMEIQFAAALHDIGKIGVSDSILRKSAPLDEAEWREMRRHSELGYQILNGIDFLKNAAEIVYAHHERYDGTGYPRGLAREEIPLGSRLFAIVDAFDAMTSKRPYRDASSREAACAEITANAGTQFDPYLVQVFLTVVQRTAAEEHGDWPGYGPRLEDHHHDTDDHNGAQPEPPHLPERIGVD